MKRAQLAVAAILACAPEEHSGVVHRVTLPDAAATVAGSGGESGAGGEAGSGGEPYVEPPGPPQVSAMMPLSGPYGTEITIQGSHLGSAARDGVSLQLGSDPSRSLEPGEQPEIVSWTESQIVFRFPFPLAGQVEITTPEGSAVAGEFEPTWIAGEPLEVPDAVSAVASIATAPGVIAAVIDTGPPQYVAQDGEGWSAQAIAASDLRPETIRLYREGDTLGGFALSTATSHEVIALDPADAFAATPTGLDTSAEYTLAGGREGASVWYRVANDWTRARPTGGAWALDGGPIADPNPSGSKHTAATTSDGSLYVGWAEDTGDALDDLGAAFFRRLLPDGASFLGKTRAGVDMDDRISSYVMTPRGSGVVARYCGTDMDPLGATSDDLLCYAGLVPSGVRSTVKESSSLRYAFDGIAPVAAYCHSTLGVRIVEEVVTGTSLSALDARGGEVVVWPCAPVVALEVDDEGQALIIVEHDGALYSPRPRTP